MAVRLGINPIGWSNDDLPELGGHIPLEQCLAEARLAGYSGIEKGGKFPNDPALLRPLLDRYGLALVGGWFSGELRARSLEEEKARIADHLRLLRAMDASVVVYAETTGTVQGAIDTPVSARPTMPEEEFPAYGERLTALAEWLAAEGCPMAFHHHMGTVIEREAEIDLLMRHTGEAVGLLLDTGHLLFAGGNIEATTRRWRSRIAHVHLKNIRPRVLRRLREEDWSFLRGVIEGVFTVPGDPEGAIDFASFLQILGEGGYAGWLVVEAEQDPAKANPLDHARLAHDTVVAALGPAGLELQG
ncbi:MAG TPA: myo-inosose-2 dehydratase [Rhodospirillales bacterium]|nr:myo-inosose-2 dehydratase [Rhodospirillales bacterium]